MDFYCASRSASLAVPELTRSADIKLNERVSLRRCAVTISFADDARAPLQFYLCGRVGCRGGGLALVPVRLRRSNFQALTTDGFGLLSLVQRQEASRSWRELQSQNIEFTIKRLLLVPSLSCASLAALRPQAKKVRLPLQ